MVPKMARNIGYLKTVGVNGEYSEKSPIKIPLNTLLIFNFDVFETNLNSGTCFIKYHFRETQ